MRYMNRVYIERIYVEREDIKYLCGDYVIWNDVVGLLDLPHQHLLLPLLLYPHNAI